MNPRKLTRTGLILLIVLMVVCFSNFTLGAEQAKIQLLWESLAEENYQQALQLSIEQGWNNPVYLELASYLSWISFNSSHQLQRIRQDLYAAQIDASDIESFLSDMATYLAKESPFYKMAEAIIQFNEYQNKSYAVSLVTEALREKETALGFFLQYAFSDDLESMQKAALLSERPGLLKEQLMFHRYNQELNERKEVDREQFVREIEELLSSDDYYFDSQDYRYFIQIGLGEKYISAIGPSGPNHEPYFGPLCAITEWESFKQFAPRHQILLAFAVAGPGGQNIWDAERLLEDIDEQTLEEYAPLVKMISIYGNFHSYQYDEVYKGADELLAMEITAPFYLPYIYDLAYEYEMFYFAGYRAEQAMIDRAVQLYDKAYALAAAESPYLQGYILQEKGRSLYYAKRYRDAIDTLLLGLSLKDEPVFYMFLSLSYYALGDLESGAAWEAKVRALFAENERILGEFEQLLHEVKVDN